jgi:hypothetical protein
MALRAYLLAQLEDDLDHDGIVKVVRDLEEIDEVTFAEPVIGLYDLVITAESNAPIEQLVEKLEQVAGIRQLSALKAIPIPARERMWKNLSGIPLSPRQNSFCRRRS